MEMLNPNDLHKKAEFALNRGREPKKVILYYALITTALSVAATALNIWMDSLIAGQGGLGNMNTRAVFSSVQAILPMALTLVSLCLNLGYQNAMMRIARRQYADQTDLKVGFRYFWPLMRMLLLQVMLYSIICLLMYQLVFTLYSFTPWAEPLISLLVPYLENPSLIMTEAVANEAFLLLIPCLILYAAACAVVVIPMAYRLRMANYCLLDNSGRGALAAMLESRKIMKGKCKKLFRVDLSLWPYYLLVVVSTVVLYLDVILAFIGVQLPVSWDVVTYGCYGGYLLIQFVTAYYLRNFAEVTYLTAYDRIREKPEDNGVVLGNIFDM